MGSRFDIVRNENIASYFFIKFYFKYRSSKVKEYNTFATTINSKFHKMGKFLGDTIPKCLYLD